MNVLCLIPSSRLTKNVHRDVLYGCWCKGKRIGGGTLPPLVTLSTATVLKNSGNHVRLLDMKEEAIRFEDVANSINDYDAAVVLTSTMSFKEDASVLEDLKKLNHRLVSIVFGAHPTYMYESCLKHPGIDIIVRKEPEFIIRDVIRELSKGGDSWKQVPGIGFMENGQIQLNDLYPFVDLNDLPMPDRSLLPRNAKYYNPIIKYYPYTTTVTSQGCPAQCTYCTAPGMTGQKLRYWKAGRVIEEIEYLLGLGYKEIYYRDEIFTVYKKRNMEVYKHVIGNHLKFSWICNAKVGNIDKEQVERMAEAGCRVIKVGVESGVQDILDRVKKGVRLQQIKDLFQWTKEFKIDTHAHFMFGMPGETEETIERTIEFMFEIEPATVDIGVCTAYPGTTLWDQLIEHHEELQDGTFIDLGNVHTDAQFNYLYANVPREYIEKSINRAYREFYMRPKYMLGWLTKVQSWGEFKNVVGSGFNVLRFSMFGD